MSDARSRLGRWLDDNIGPPLYYCEVCRLRVKVTAVPGGEEPRIDRTCKHKDAMVMAPRKAHMVGRGGMNLRRKTSWRVRRLFCNLLQRSL